MYMEFMLLTEGIVLFSEKNLYGKLYYWQKRFHQLMAPGYGHGSHTRPHSKIQDKTLLGWRSLRDERRYVCPNSQIIGDSLNYSWYSTIKPCCTVVHTIAYVNTMRGFRDLRMKMSTLLWLIIS